MPHSWRFAHHVAADLVRQVEYLPWPGRVEMFDTYFLRQAEAMLRPRGLTALVGGPSPPSGEPLEPHQLEQRCGRFADWSRTMVTAVLLDLDERMEVMSAEQGLTYLLSRDLGYTKAAAVWTTFHGMSGDRAGAAPPAGLCPGAAGGQPQRYRLALHGPRRLLDRGHGAQLIPAAALPQALRASAYAATPAAFALSTR